MKQTMSKRNVAKFHMLLKKKAPISDIVKILKVSKETLKRFTPGKHQAFAEQQKQKLALEAAEKLETDKAAEVVAEAAKKVVKKDK